MLVIFVKSCRCTCILFRSFYVREVTQFLEGQDLAVDIVEDLTSQDSQIGRAHV